MTNEIRGLVFEEPERPVIATMPMPEPGPNELLIRTRAVGICHSDYELLAGRYIIPISYPVTPGHEWCGEVVEKGANVSGFEVGDRVVGECVIRTPERIHHFGFSMSGADREYFVARPEWLHKLPNSLDDKAGALIEPFTCGFYAVLRNGGTNASETVVVSGGGTIGLVSAAAAIGMGAQTIVVDPIARRRETALKLGAAAALDPGEDPVARIREMTEGRGADRHRGLRPRRVACRRVRLCARGRPGVDGGHQHRQEIPVELGKIQIKNLQVRGCIGSPGVWPAAIRFLERTGLDLSPIQTHDFSLFDGVDAFEFGKNPQESIKITLLAS